MKVSEKLGRPLAPSERCFNDGTLMTKDQIIDLARDEDRPDHHRFYCAASLFAPEPVVGEVAEGQDPEGPLPPGGHMASLMSKWRRSTPMPSSTSRATVTSTTEMAAAWVSSSLCERL